jgi:hypothetical protein
MSQYFKYLTISIGFLFILSIFEYGFFSILISLGIPWQPAIFFLVPQILIIIVVAFYYEDHK